MTIDSTIRKLNDYNDALSIVASASNGMDKDSIQSNSLTINDKTIISNLIKLNQHIIQALQFLKHNNRSFLNIIPAEDIVEELNVLTNDYSNLDAFINALHHSFLRGTFSVNSSEEYADTINLWVKVLKPKKSSIDQIASDNKLANLTRIFIGLVAVALILFAMIKLQLMWASLLVAGAMGLIGMRLWDNSRGRDQLAVISAIVVTTGAALYAGVFTSVMIPSFGFMAITFLIQYFHQNAIARAAKKYEHSEQILGNIRNTFTAILDESHEAVDYNMSESSTAVHVTTNRRAKSSAHTNRYDVAMNNDVDNYSLQWSKFHMKHSALFRAVNEAHEKEYGSQNEKSRTSSLM
ncbi:MAG TPA: hypothetical protein VHD33_03770 [Legionellaceae bacterium]|nr:hypothetical protein [Legionellaceae bacterium]